MSVGMSCPAFLLCDYFARHGQRIERIYIAMESGAEAADRLRADLRGRNIELLLDVMMAEALISGATTDLDDAALALNALLNEIADRRMPLGEARTITSIGINFRKAVTIPEILPALEMGYGGYAISWVRGVFRHLNLGTPHIL